VCRGCFWAYVDRLDGTEATLHSCIAVAESGELTVNDLHRL